MSINLFNTLPALCISVLFLIISWLISRTQLFQNIFFGSVAFISFYLIGCFNYQSRLPKFQNSHYSHAVVKSTSERNLVQLKVVEIIKPDRYNKKYIASVQAINGKSVLGRCLLYIPMDSLSAAPVIDDVLLVYVHLSKIRTPLNPHQFNYSKYMKTLGVYHEIRLKEEYIVKKTLGGLTLKGLAEKSREYLIKKLEKTSIEKDQRAILQALVLGQKRDISRELYSNYAAAGAVHILAVSGLHVGILFLLFSKVLSFLNYLKYGRIIRSALLIICLWGFAFITGLSPSVTRAVTMFSLFAFATAIDRQTSTVNTLFLSYFLLLLINPLLILHIGFQLSYLAVLSIIVIQPKLTKYYRPKFFVDKLLWDVSTVSFAAQIGLAPLSLYYFHQFPGLFFLTNIMVIPVLSMLLAGGIIIVILAASNALPNWVSLTYNTIIKYLNTFINWVAQQDTFLFSEIHFSEGKLLGSYLLIASLIFLWKSFSYSKLILSTVWFALLICVFIWDKQQNSTNQLLLFHKSRSTILASKNKEQLRIFRRNTLEELKNSYPIKGYRTALNIEALSEEELPKYFKYNKTRMLIIDSSSVYPQQSTADIIILIESPKLHLERLIDSLQPEIIVADGSNYSSYIDRWEITCKNKKLPFHHTGAKGAFIIE